MSGWRDDPRVRPLLAVIALLIGAWLAWEGHAMM
jgi:hypothetical protein